MKFRTILAGVLATLVCGQSVAAASAYYDGEYYYDDIGRYKLLGDVNNDGAFNVADLVSMHQWILGNADLDAPYNGDFYRDGSLDVFDLTAMQNALIERFSIPTPLFGSVNLCADYSPSEIEETGEFDDEFKLGQTNFSLELLKRSLKEDDNSLISPYSATRALAMTANGANGQTLKEMEKVLCNGMSIDDLNKYLYMQTTNEKPRYKYDTTTVSNANSIWIRPDIKTDPEFIQKNVDYFGSEIFSTPMDRTTGEDLNYWVNEKTKGMISDLVDPELFEQTDRYAILLANALAFEGKWKEEFGKAVDDKFTASDGTVQDAQMMSSMESVYLCDDKATGFKKSYIGSYSFVALLPNEGITVDEYVNDLDAASFQKTLSKPVYTKVDVTAPKFDFDDDIKMGDMLKDMGIKAAFSDNADFSGMTTDDHFLKISDVIQKTHIEVDEEGTRAAAATVVLVADGCAPDPEEPKIVRLDRPFVFAIVDDYTNIPLFIGTVKTLK